MTCSRTVLFSIMVLDDSNSLSIITVSYDYQLTHLPGDVLTPVSPTPFTLTHQIFLKSCEFLGRSDHVLLTRSKWYCPPCEFSRTWALLAKHGDSTSFPTLAEVTEFTSETDGTLATWQHGGLVSMSFFFLTGFVSWTYFRVAVQKPLFWSFQSKGLESNIVLCQRNANWLFFKNYKEKNAFLIKSYGWYYPMQHSQENKSIYFQDSYQHFKECPSCNEGAVF